MLESKRSLIHAALGVACALGGPAALAQESSAASTVNPDETLVELTVTASRI